jgi:hypothetical protein
VKNKRNEDEKGMTKTEEDFKPDSRNDASAKENVRPLNNSKKDRAGGPRTIA